MFSAFHGLVNASVVSSFLRLDASKIATTSDIATWLELKHFVDALSSCIFRLSLSLHDALQDFVVGTAARAGSSLFEEAHAGLGMIRRPQRLASPPAIVPFKIVEQTPPSFIYHDLTDVVSHAIWHDSCAGIPRVQLEITNSLIKSRVDLRPIAFYHQKWCDLRPLIEAADGDVDAIFRLIKEAFADFKWTPCGLVDFLKRRRKFRAIKRSSRMPELKAHDTLFIGGAFWVEREIIDFCRRAADRRANLIVLFHDLIPLTVPYFTGHDFRAEFLEMLRLQAHFVVTTPYNGHELESVRRGYLTAETVTNFSIVPLADEFPGAIRNARPLTTSDRLASLIGQDFALCVGTIEVRKNHLTLLAIWEQLAVELGDCLPRLVVAGRRGWKADAALEKLDQANSSSNLIKFVEAPTDSELRWLYSSCRFTVFPSYFEGWGLPVGESFWFGKPCAASNASSIPAVGRDLCSYFSPFDPGEMKEAIRALLNPETRRIYQAKIESTPLRAWKDVASELKTIIMERRFSPSDATPSLESRQD
jgi:glycosyltransferase involved in cell wall biosynthesis